MSSMETTPRRQNDATSSHERSTWLVVAGWAGIIGPVLFTIAFLAQEQFHRGDYSPVAEPVSALAAMPHGWIQGVNFVVFGVLTIVFAAGLHWGLRPSKAGVLGPALFLVSGIGLLLGAAFPLAKDAQGVTYDPGGHGIAGSLFFLGSALALIVVSRRVAHDPRWRGLARFTLAAGIISIAVFPVFGALVIPDDAPLHEWGGLAQRALILLVLFPCRIALSLRLLRTAR